MSALWGVVGANGRLLGRVPADWRPGPLSNLTLVPPEVADVTPLPEPYTPPPPEPVESVPAWAAKAALEDAGLLDEAQAKAALLGTTWKWRFAQANDWLRADVLPLGLALGLSEAQVDDLLRDAMARAG